MSDGIYSNSRGGYSYSGNSYSTWMNNPGGKSRGINFLDGYIKFPVTKNEVTINVGANYGRTSWLSSLIGGVVNLGTQVFLLGLIGKLGNKQGAAKAQANIPLDSYWANFRANLQKPLQISAGITGGAATTNTTQQPVQQAVQQPVQQQQVQKQQPVQEEQATQQAAATEEVTVPKDKATENIKEAIATNNKIPTSGIKGAIKGEKYAADGKGYPISFEVHDSTKNTTGKTDSAGNKLCDVYYFQLVGGQPKNTEKPKYQCIKVDLFVINKNDVTVNFNTFEVGSGFEDDGNGKQIFKGKLMMSTDSSVPTVQKKANINMQEGTKQTYTKS